MSPLRSTAAVVGTTDTGLARVGTTTIWAVSHSMVLSMKARAFGVVDVLRAPRTLIVIDVASFAREDTTTAGLFGLRLGSVLTIFREDITRHLMAPFQVRVEALVPLWPLLVQVQRTHSLPSPH